MSFPDIFPNMWCRYPQCRNPRAASASTPVMFILLCRSEWSIDLAVLRLVNGLLLLEKEGSGRFQTWMSSRCQEQPEEVEKGSGQGGSRTHTGFPARF